MNILAIHGLGFISVPSLVARETVTRFGLRTIGRSDDCQQQYYAITAEPRLAHPAVLALTSKAKAALAV